MEKIRARHQGRKNIYVHNDLSNAASHFKDQIDEKIANNDLEGISFEYMACLVMLAFTFEAKINFLGHKLISNWKERQPFKDKISEVIKYLSHEPNWDERPYSSISMLKEFRDSIAHGKPIETEFDEEVIAPQETIDRRIDLDGEWVKYCSHENVFEAYEDVKAIWKELLDLANLQIFETITHGSSGLTFIEKIVDKNK